MESVCKLVGVLVDEHSLYLSVVASPAPHGGYLVLRFVGCETYFFFIFSSFMRVPFPRQRLLAGAIRVRIE